MSPGSRPLGTLAWLDLTTPDVDSAADFYSRPFGWKLESDDAPVGRYVIGLTDAGPVAGSMAAPPGEDAAPPAWVLLFGVADAAEAFDHACRLGATGGDSMAWGQPGAVSWAETQSPGPPGKWGVYEGVIGWTQGTETDGYRVLERDGVQVAGLMAMPTEVPAEVPSYWLAYFAVDDVDGACQQNGELGGSVLAPTVTVQDMRFAVAADPFGAVFGILQTSG